MIKNLFHAFLGTVAFLVLGWLASRPAEVRWMTHHKDVHYAALGALIVLALFVIVCLVLAVRPAKPESAGPRYGRPAPARRR
jgi:uncharacterized membrane-anchored protein